MIRFFQKIILFIKSTKIGKFFTNIYHQFNFRKINKLCGFQKKNDEHPKSHLDLLEKYLETKLTLFLYSPKNTLMFPVYENPIVSIIIVNYNQTAFLFECLNSIILNVNVTYELIILDNKSDDLTRTFLNRIQNAKIILEESNLDFILGNNKAATFSKGEYLFFLNNDTYVSKNAIENLLAVFKENKKTGIVGSKIIRTNGELQEAGCMVWADGSVEGYGKNSNKPFDCSFNFLRRVDFCSGASILIKKHLFEKLNGFSTKFLPAYYEDVDLALRCKNLGYETYYQPESHILHKENGKISGRAKSLNSKNQPIFYLEHINYLQTIHIPNLIYHQRSADKARRILFIDDELPDTLKGAGQPRTKALLDFMISEGFQVTFFPLFNNAAVHENLLFYQQKGVEIFDRSDSPAKFLYERKGLFDTIVVSRPHNAARIIGILNWLFPNAELIYDAEALFFSREIEKGIFENRPVDDVTKNNLRANEINLIRKFNKIIMVSEKEKEQVFLEFPDKKIHVWPMPYKTREITPPFGLRKNLLYLGGLTSQNQPNVDGIMFFINRVFPKIKSKIPEIKLLLIGKIEDVNVRHLLNSEILSLGSLKDIENHFDSVKIFICPQPYGAGISLKLLEAMSHGVPCVASHVATRGLPEGENGVITVSSESDYVEAISHLYQDEDSWEVSKKKNITFMNKNFSHPIMLEKFKCIFEI